MSLSKAGLVSPINVTATERDQITDKDPGYIVFNSTIGEAEMWTGTQWIILGSRPGNIVYRGTINATTTAPTSQPPQNGDMYINEGTGVAVAGWANLTGVGVAPNDRMIFDGTEWSLVSTTGGVPTLQIVTDAGDTTNRTITTAGYITAGNVQATDGLFSGNVGVGTTSPDELLHVQGSGNTTAKVSSSRDDRYARTLFQSDNQFIAGYGPSHSSQPNELSLKNYWANGDINFWTTEIDGSGTKRLTIKPDGNVGIGTDTPYSQLHLSGAAPYFTYTNTDAGTDLKNWMTSAGSDGKFRLRSGTDALSYINAVTVDHSGNVGVAITSPEERLHVNGNAKIRNCDIKNIGSGGATRTSLQLTGADTYPPNAGAIYIKEGTTNTAYISYDGQAYFANSFGIGTTGADNLGAVNPPYLALYASGGARLGIFGSGGRWWYAHGEETSKFTIGCRVSSNSADADKVTIDTAGNVGIGTDSPSALLEIGPADNSIQLTGADLRFTRNASYIQHRGTGSLRVRDKDSNNYITFDYNSGNNRISFASQDYTTFNTGGSIAMRILASGYVGIGTDNPKDELHVAGDGVFRNNGYIGFNIYNNGTWKQDTAGSGAVVKHNKDIGLQFYTGADSGNGADGAATLGTRMTITDAGNVGIGTSDPADKLQVEGNIRAGGKTSQGTADGVTIYNQGQVQVSRAAAQNIWAGYTTGTNAVTSSITGAGKLFATTYDLESLDPLPS